MNYKNLRRIDQYLFVNIIRQSYEAEKAWRDFIDEYSNRSIIERNAYNMFSKEKRKNLSEISEIFNMWYNMPIEEKEKWFNKSYTIKEMEKNINFGTVQDFLSTYEHNS